jgi:hypothetical protein
MSEFRSRFTTNGTTFTSGGLEIELNWQEVGDLMDVLKEMPGWVESLAIAIEDHRETLPGTDEEAGVLLGAIEILLQRGHPSGALRRLHYALRQRPRPPARE